MEKLKEKFIAMLPILFDGTGMINHGLIMSPGAEENELEVVSLDVESPKECMYNFISLCGKAESLEFILGIQREFRGKKYLTIISYDESIEPSWEIGVSEFAPGTKEFNIDWSYEQTIAKIMHTEIHLCLELLAAEEEKRKVIAHK